MARTVTVKVVLDSKDAEAGAERVQRKFKSALDSSTLGINSTRQAVSGLTSALATLGAAAVFKQVAQFGIDLDKARNAMTALTGSVAAANAKMAELRELAKASPGVTTSFATQLFNQLKAIQGISDQTINSVIKSLGKLNTVFSDVGPEFSRNLVQIFQQGFERSDIKEALGRVPIFEQLLESAFGTKDAAKLRKLKEAGKLTLGGFLDGFSGAIQSDPRFKDIQESLGGKMQKALEDTKIKLAELGEKMLQTLLPALDKILPSLNAMLEFFNKLPTGLQAATIGVLAFAPAINTLTGAIVGLKSATIGLGAFLASPAGVAVLGLVGLATAGFALEDLIRNKIPSNVRGAIPQVPTDLQGNPIFKQAPPGEVVGDFVTKNLDFSRKLKAFDEATGKFGGSSSATKTLADLVTGAGKGKAKEAEKVPIDLLFFATSRKVDLPAGQRAVDDQMGELSRAFLRQQKDEAQAFQGIVKEIQSNNAKAAKEALEAQTKFNEALKEAAERAQELDPAFRFMRGLKGETDATASAFERLGQRIGDAFGDLRNLLSSLGAAVKQFFGDLLSATIRTTLASAIRPLFGNAGGGILGSLGNIFRTPSLAGGDGISVPSSVTAPVFGGLFGSGGAGAGAAAQRFGQLTLDPLTAKEFGLKPSFLGGIGKSFAGAAPFLGAGLGSGIGGQSTLGNILGSAGGFLTGGFLGATLAPGIFSGAAAGLLTNPFTAIAGVGLLVGGALLGKAKQRRQDEEASGQMLTQALAQIRELKAGVDSGAIPGSQARAIFENQILAQFIQGINSLKTESVRRSRLTNQVADLRRVFNELIEPSIVAQAAKQATSAANALAFSRQIPEFATGGTTRGGLAFLHEGEKILNLQQQSAVRAIAGPNVFERAGVPGPSANRNFDIGGTMPANGGSRTDQPIVIELQVVNRMTTKDAEGIVVTGISGDRGRTVIVNQVKKAKSNREL